MIKIIMFQTFFQVFSYKISQKILLLTFRSNLVITSIQLLNDNYYL